MARSFSATKLLVPIAVGIAVGSALGIVALRYLRNRKATHAPDSQQNGANAMVELVPPTVFTDDEPTAIEAALRDALSAEDVQATDVAPMEKGWIGNTRTLVLHRPDSAYLPAEEHRQYFQSEDEALAAGYRRAANE